MRRLLVGVAPFAVVVAVYFAVVALWPSSPDDKAGDTGSTTTLSPTSTTVGAVGSAPGEGWDALPSHSEVEVHAYAAVLAAIPVPHEPVVVTAPATPVPAPDPTPVRDGGSIWDRLAQCESGGDWSANTGNGHSGGLQWLHDTWVRAGGQQYATYAWQATREQEIAVAEAWLARTSWAQWPGCAARLGLR